ncbi:MAG TPA: hypothetical protein VNK04_16955, partial [Gemmataceae bacterium]|nr:hypothetical protein [Gemmataceae bacterium]
GLESADLAISYDGERLEALEVRRGSLTADFDLFAVHTDPQSATIRVGLGRSAGPINGQGPGSVIEVVFRIRPDAPPGAAIINLRRDLAATVTQLNEGGLVLVPAPDNAAGDALDGGIIVAGPIPPTVERVVVKTGARGTRRLTVVFSTAVHFRGSPAEAFRLLGPRGPARLRVLTSLDETGTRTVARLLFRGREITGGSYTLTIDGDRIIDAAAQAMDGDRDGVPDGNAVETFFRFYGDTWVKRPHFMVLRRALGRSI